MSNTIPKQIYTFRNNLVYVLLTTLWILFFAIVYTPTFGHSEEAVALWNQHSSLCISIVCAINLVATSITRTLFCLAAKKREVSPLTYTVLQVIEMTIVGMFCNLFLSLYFKIAYFALLPTTLIIGLLIEAMPYWIYWEYVVKQHREEIIDNYSITIAELRKGLDPTGEHLSLKFIDEKGNVKLVVPAERIFSIESAGNYVTISYENNGKITRFALRNTIKAIEEMCDAHGLVRCHRSWVVNIRKVNLLRKDNDGVYAEMGIEGFNNIPVSKSYMENVVHRLSNI